MLTVRQHAPTCIVRTAEPRFGVDAGLICAGQSKGDAGVADEDILDPWVEKWIAENPMMANPLEEFTPEILALARGPVGAPPTREIAHIEDQWVGDVPVRIYTGPRNSPPASWSIFTAVGSSSAASASWTTWLGSWPMLLVPS